MHSRAKDTEARGKNLARGNHDWAHLAYTIWAYTIWAYTIWAYTIWPDCGREVCKRDRSIAVAHGLEELCETPTPGAMKRTRCRGKRNAGAAEEES